MVRLSESEVLRRLQGWSESVTRPGGWVVISVPGERVARAAPGFQARLRPWIDHLIADGDPVIEATPAAAAGLGEPAEALRERLVRALGARFPDHAAAPPTPRPADSLAALLRRLAADHLAPPSRRLFLVLHDLGALRPRLGGRADNPLARLLPAQLPRGVFVVVTVGDQAPGVPWLLGLAEVEQLPLSPGPASEMGAGDPEDLENSAEDPESPGVTDPKSSPLAPKVGAGDPEAGPAWELRRAIAGGQWTEVLRRVEDPTELAAIVEDGGLGGSLGDLGEAIARAPAALRPGLVAIEAALEAIGPALAEPRPAASAGAPTAAEPRESGLWGFEGLLWGALIDRGRAPEELAARFAGALPPLRRRLPLLRARDHAEARLEGHDGPILALALAAAAPAAAAPAAAADGGSGDDRSPRLLASASADGTLKIWSLGEPGCELRSLHGHRGPVNACLFTTTGDLLSGGDDGEVFFWDRDPAVASPRRLAYEEGGVEAIAWLPAASDPPGPDIYNFGDSLGFVVLGTGGRLSLWARGEPEPRAVVDAHELGGTALAVDPQGRWVATGSHDRTVKLWALPGLEPLRTLEGPEYAVVGLAVDRHGQRIAAAAYDNSLRLWEVARGALLKSFWGHDSWVMDCAFVGSPDHGGPGDHGDHGQWLLSAGRDRTLRLWDPETADERACLRGHRGQVRAVAVGPRGEIYSGGDDRTIRRWRATQALPPPADGHRGAITACAIGQVQDDQETSQKSNQKIYTAGVDGTLRAWDPATGGERRVYRGHEHAVFGLVVTAGPGGERLISGGADKTVKIWDPSADEPLRRLVGPTAWVLACAVEPAGAGEAPPRIAAIDRSGAITLWSATTGDALRTWQAHPGEARGLLFTPRGLVSAGDDGRIRVWDPDDASERMTLAGHDGPIRALALTGDGEHLLSAGDDGTLRRWSLARGRERATLRGHQGPVVGVAALGDDHLLSASADRSLRLWSSAGRCLALLRGERPFTALAAVTGGSRGGSVALAGDDTGDLWWLAVDPARAGA